MPEDSRSTLIHRRTITTDFAYMYPGEWRVHGSDQVENFSGPEAILDAGWIVE